MCRPSGETPSLTYLMDVLKKIILSVSTGREDDFSIQKLGLHGEMIQSLRFNSEKCFGLCFQTIVFVEKFKHQKCKFRRFLEAMRNNAQQLSESENVHKACPRFSWFSLHSPLYCHTMSAFQKINPLGGCQLFNKNSLKNNIFTYKKYFKLTHMSRDSSVFVELW